MASSKNHKILTVIQTIGRSFFLPISILPVAGLLLGIGASFSNLSAVQQYVLESIMGAGTVLNLEQARRAVDAGARYIVSPGYNMQVVDWCLEHEVPVLPAGVTPTEVTALVNAGLEVTKFFPAAQYGGLATIKALASVFVGHRFMPTGGVSASNLREYLECPAILACGGTWMVKPDLIRAGEFDRMLELTSEASALVREIRG